MIFLATTGEGIFSTGEAVMTGAGGAALAKAVGAGEAEANERIEACTKAREIVECLIFPIASDIVVQSRIPKKQKEK
jgi:hypothetical protein